MTVCENNNQRRFMGIGGHGTRAEVDKVESMSANCRLRRSCGLYSCAIYRAKSPFTAMPTSHHVILIRPEASAAAWGAPCNGCGVCCLLEPCPLGMVLSRKRRGACVALRWQDDARQYRCGAVMAPKEVLQLALPKSPRHGFPPGLGFGPFGKALDTGLGCDGAVRAGRLPLKLPSSCR